MKHKITPIDANRKWFEIKNVTADSADVYLYDEIGVWGVSAADVIAQLNAITVPTINLHINSPGGSVFEGFAIYNALNLHAAKVNVHIDGLAASIASVIAMAGDEINMADNAMLMIHEVMCGVFGTATDLRKQADLCDTLQGNVLAIYAARTGQKPDDLAAMMADETWLTAAQAKEKGFCTATIAAKKISACFDLKAYRKAPENFLQPQGEDRKNPPLSLLTRKQALLEKAHR